MSVIADSVSGIPVTFVDIADTVRYVVIVTVMYLK